jgi:hypothetical protein
VPLFEDRVPHWYAFRRNLDYREHDFIKD